MIQRSRRRLSYLLFLGAALLGGGSAAALGQVLPGGAAESHGHGPAGGAEVVKPDVLRLSEEFGVALGNDIPLVLSPAVNIDAILAEDANQPLEDKTLRYGVGLDVFCGLTEGRWIEIPKERGGGSLWVVDVVSLNAIGLRLHFRDCNLPEGARAVVFAPSDNGRSVVGPIERRGLTDSGEFWTPTRFGERVRVELYVPRGAKIDGNPFLIDSVQHIYRNPVAAVAAREELLRGAGPCHNDVTCFPAWANTAKAVAGIGTVNSNSLYCSGTMLSTTAADETPYYLTANHCLSTAASANSAEIYWLYQTATCNGSVPSLATVPQSAPCTLLSTQATPDYTLLMVEGSIPRTQLYWAGWTSAAVNDGTVSACIHHPAGDFKRISFCTKASNPTCSATQHVRANWTDGPTEPGSSGSGLFRSDTQQLYGQLTCGPSACGNETNDSYGYFNTYFSSISSLLAAGSDDALEPDDSCAGARAMSPGTSSNLIVKSTDEDWYALTLMPGQQLTATATFTHANGDIDLQAYTTCGGPVVAASAGSTGTETLNYTYAAGGTVYVRVFLASDSRNTYSITFSVTGGSPDDGLEQNDSCAAARAMTAGTSSNLIVKSTDEDWYSVALTSGQTLNATWSFTNASGDVDVQAFTTCGGAVVASSTGTTDSETISYTATSATTVYLRTYLFSGTQNTYSMTIGVQSPADTLILVSFTSAVSTLPGLGTVQNEDVVAYNTRTGAWSLVFDGSDLGWGGLTIDALTVNASDEFIFSFTADTAVAGVTGGPNGTTVDDGDLVRFTPTTLGATTAGVTSFYFDGSDVGLDEAVGAEDIDAVSLTPAGGILISTSGTNNVLGSNALDEDMVLFTPTALGAATAGTWSFYFDGSDVDLATTADEDIDAAELDAAGNLLLSTVGPYSVPGLSGDDKDLIQFSPTSLGATTAGAYSMFLSLTSLGIDPTEDVAAIGITTDPLLGVYYSTAGPAAPACPADWTGDGSVDSEDLFYFVDEFFIGNANFNDDETTDSQDLMDFLESFFSGC